ncbi:MAG: PASTA domain-containing protein [Spirochaetes bacterium]|jgi:beta-lactam-binding protein with PASTA domain|nr:PASTA domain-containing protein [Spirochaetota bacterium]
MEDSQKKPGFFVRNRKFFVLMVVYVTFFMLVSTFMLVKLNQPAGKVRMPDVTGKDFKSVYNTLVNRELRPVISFHDASDVASGLILRQHPPSGKIIPKDSRVRLVVSRSNFKVDVPKVDGSPLVIAKNKLSTLHIGEKKVSLGIGVVSYIPSADHEDGIVIEQSPRAGEKVAPHSKVNLLVSMGVLGRDSAMPDLVGQHIDLGFDLVLSLGLSVRQKIVPADSPEDSGKILEQTIKPGTVVEDGAELLLTVAYYERENRYYQSYEKVSFVVPKDSEESFYEVWIDDEEQRRVRFSKMCKPGETVVFVFHRTGNARIEIIKNKQKEKVLSLDVDTF